MVVVPGAQCHGSSGCSTKPLVREVVNSIIFDDTDSILEILQDRLPLASSMLLAFIGLFVWPTPRPRSVG